MTYLIASIAWSRAGTRTLALTEEHVGPRSASSEPRWMGQDREWLNRTLGGCLSDCPLWAEVLTGLSLPWVQRVPVGRIKVGSGLLRIESCEEETVGSGVSCRAGSDQSTRCG